MSEPTQKDFERFQRSYGWSKVINIFFYLLAALTFVAWFAVVRPHKAPAGHGDEDWNNLSAWLPGLAAFLIGMLSGIAVLVTRRLGKRSGEWGSKHAHLYVPVVLSVVAAAWVVITIVTSDPSPQS